MLLFLRALTGALLVATTGAALAQPAPPAPGDGPLFISPAGQPFRSESRREPPMQVWFEQADADHDGTITQAEFLADFERAFVAFDINGDGEIDPQEVNRYETLTFPEMSNTNFRGSRSQPQRAAGGTRGRGAAVGTTRRSMGGAARFGLLPIYHPLMEADENMNRGINRIEFQAAARQRFEQLGGTAEQGLTLESIRRRRR